MKTFKQIDYIIQIALISGCVLFTVSNIIFKYSRPVFDAYIPGYFIVGGWQILSVIIHFFAPKHYKIKSRSVYLWLLLVTLIAGLLSLGAGDDLILGFMVILLFWSPILAVIYLVTCIKETRALLKVVK